MLFRSGKKGGGCNILRGHDNVQGSSDMGCFPDSLPGYYGIGKNVWEYYAKNWGVDYNWLVSQHKSQELMSVPGFTLARWWAGVLDGKNGNDAIDNAGTNLKALVCVGNGITSTSQQAKVKEGLDNLEMFVCIDAFANDAVALTDKQDDVFLLPASTQFETSGTVVATNRSAQWRYQVVEPLYESKPDHEILFEFAKRLGFYDEFTQSLRNISGKSTFTWPDDATREIALIIQSVGYSGRTPERLKNHTDNWHLFSEVEMQGVGGSVKGEYYGLPWPCWTPQHPGSPILYDISKPVIEGGMGFRNRFGLEHNGVSQLADESATVANSKVRGGYPQITKANIEEVLGIKLSDEEREKMGPSWAMDTSNIIAQKCMEAGVAPYGNARARCIIWEWSKFDHQIPTHREPIHSPRTDLVKEFPSFADRPKHFRVDTKFSSLQQSRDWAKEFPINLVTGRLVNMSGAGAETRASVYLCDLTPEMYADINPALGADYGIRNGDMIWIHSPEGTKIKVKARFSHSVLPDRIFLPFHWAGYFQGEDMSSKYPEGTLPYSVGENANTVTNYGYDIITQIPETKGGLCRIEKA